MLLFIFSFSPSLVSLSTFNTRPLSFLFDQSYSWNGKGHYERSV